VLLDGQRLCLSDAARALNLTPSTLHFRLVARTHDANYMDVDVRAVGADVAHSAKPAGKADEPPCRAA
jgi:hypothetical protein